jgi:plasmid stabilization system protein ParE
MGRTLEIHPEATEEARAARQWYAARSQDAADAFVAELDAAIAYVVQRADELPKYMYGTRYYLLHRFPYLVVYRTKGEVIQVIAVAHGHRRPGYWRSR